MPSRFQKSYGDASIHAERKGHDKACVNIARPDVFTTSACKELRKCNNRALPSTERADHCEAYLNITKKK